MDTYGHLFPSQNREWVNKLDEESFVPASYPEQGNGQGRQEQLTDKPLDFQGDLLVAVPRIERGTRGL